MREPNTKPDRDQLLNTFLDNIAPQQKPDGTTLNADVRQSLDDAIVEKLSTPNADPYLHHILVLLCHFSARRHKPTEEGEGETPVEPLRGGSAGASLSH